MLGEHAPHYEEFAPNILKRLEELEGAVKELEGRTGALQDLAQRADNFLFKDEEGKPALATIAYRVHKHVVVLCEWASAARRAVRAVARLLKALAIICVSASAIYLTATHFGELEVLGKLLHEVLR